MRLAIFLCIFFTRVIFGETGCMTPAQFQKQLDELGELSNGIADSDELPVPITAQAKPDDVDESKDVTFTLFTKKNPIKGQILKIGKVNELDGSYFDSRKPTRIITHGWYKRGTDACCIAIRDAYLSQKDCNVIIVDWSKYSMNKAYLYSACKVNSVGFKVAEMIEFLENHGNMLLTTTTLVGHSLGAHVMGVAGSQSTSGHKINSIVGLDPALPGFNFATGGSSLSKDAAKHVQIIHTNAGILGYLGPIGHLDFYPNGGSRQPGCPIHRPGCSHARSWKFFAESISAPFRGIKCDSYKHLESCAKKGLAVTATMGGYNVSPTIAKPGKYYLKTNDKAPFYKS